MEAALLSSGVGGEALLLATSAEQGAQYTTHDLASQLGAYRAGGTLGRSFEKVSRGACLPGATRRRGGLLGLLFLACPDHQLFVGGVPIDLMVVCRANQ
jgi:hypothetical protein